MIVVDPYSSQLWAKGSDYEHIFGSGKERNQDVLRFRQYKERRKVQESGTKEQWNQTLNEPFAVPAAAKSLQSCPTLYNPIDGSPLGSTVPGILQARTLEWVAISFSSAWKWKVKVKSLSPVQLLATPWTAAYQAPPPMGFSRQEYWSGVPLPSPYTYRYMYI